MTPQDDENGKWADIVLFIRSLIFNVAFYLVLIVYMIAAIVTFFLPPIAIVRVAQFWSRTMIWQLRVICGIHVEFRGVEKIPPGPLMVAAKHQSAWETIALLALFDYPLFILKRELTWLPLFGWFLIKARMIPIDRKAGARVMKQMTELARTRIASGRQLIIFPEGTRKAVDSPPDYRFGVAQIYADCGAPCLPVALNAGLFWPRRTFLRYPGTVLVEFLDVIPPGLPPKDFLTEISGSIESATARLVEEGRREQRALGVKSPLL